MRPLVMAIALILGPQSSALPPQTAESLIGPGSWYPFQRGLQTVQLSTIRWDQTQRCSHLHKRWQNEFDHKLRRPEAAFYAGPLCGAP